MECRLRRLDIRVPTTNPNQANKGVVWVLSGPEDKSRGASHGGSHWDVQTPGRGYVNLYLGGRRR
uniref:polymorphic toxin type 37 domain-containing protein n=1 Tax=Paraburkholderia terricola TaxID=169427 RepID=UPI0035B51615